MFYIMYYVVKKWLFLIGSTKDMMMFRGVAQLGLARLLWEQEVGGSNPLTPTILSRPQKGYGERFSPRLAEIKNLLYLGDLIHF